MKWGANDQLTVKLPHGTEPNELDRVLLMDQIHSVQGHLYESLGIKTDDLA